MAVVDYFLKIDGIDGESSDDKHKNEIQVESWSFGETQTGTGAYGGGGPYHSGSVETALLADRGIKCVAEGCFHVGMSEVLLDDD